VRRFTNANTNANVTSTSSKITSVVYILVYAMVTVIISGLYGYVAVIFNHLVFTSSFETAFNQDFIRSCTTECISLFFRRCWKSSSPLNGAGCGSHLSVACPIIGY
jgi:hypothetical protein